MMRLLASAVELKILKFHNLVESTYYSKVLSHLRQYEDNLVNPRLVEVKLGRL